MSCLAFDRRPAKLPETVILVKDNIPTREIHPAPAVGRVIDIPTELSGHAEERGRELRTQALEECGPFMQWP
jgi:hypothetical protein